MAMPSVIEFTGVALACSLNTHYACTQEVSCVTGSRKMHGAAGVHPAAPTQLAVGSVASSRRLLLSLPRFTRRSVTTRSSAAPGRCASGIFHSAGRQLSRACRGILPDVYPWAEPRAWRAGLRGLACRAHGTRQLDMLVAGKGPCARQLPHGGQQAAKGGVAGARGPDSGRAARPSQ
jgi:hypothetical protein